MVNLPVFDVPPAGRSADLGWLLQNTQANDEAVCTFLLDVLRGEIERLAAAFLHSPADIIAAVEEAIAWAVANRQQYHSEVSGKAWLFRHILQECEKVLPPGQRAADVFDPGAYSSPISRPHYDELLQALDKESALLLVLHYAHDLSPEEIAYMLDQPAEQVQAGFQQYRERLAEHQRACPICVSATGDLAMLETLLRKALSARDPVFRLDETHLVHWRSSILRRANHQQANRHTRLHSRQIVQAGLFLVLLGIGWLFTGRLSNARPSAPPVANSQPPAVTTSSPQARALPGQDPLPTPLPASPAAPIPPSGSPSLAEILQLANNSRNTWHTLWANVQVSRHDLAVDGTTPQQPIRKQVWISQPSLVRVITGPLNALPSATYVVAGGNISGQSFENGQAYTDSTALLLPDTDLQKLFMLENTFLKAGTFSMVGRDTAAGRSAWVIEWSASASGPIYRFWVDVQYGVILDRREYESSDLKNVISDIQVSAITYNAPVHPAIFELQQYKGDHFAFDFSGAPEIPDLSSTLASQSPVSAPANAADGLPFVRNPPLSCERSPDGSKLAYTMPALGTGGDTTLSVLDVSGKQSAYPALRNGITTGDYAFSPDGQRLAFFGCDKASGFCGVFLLNTQSQKLTRLLPTSYADYIFWKPDGRSLALVGEDDTSGVLALKAGTNLLMNEIATLAQKWHFLVIDANSGQITYKRVFEWAQMSAPQDSPTNTWNTPFKSRLPGPQGCTTQTGNGK